MVVRKLKTQPSPLNTFLWPVRVYHEDSDTAGIVYYANYLKFMERARTEWLRELGFEQTVLAQQYNIVFVVRTLSIDYLRPARFNDELIVSVELLVARGSLIEIAQTIQRDAQTIVAANVKLACVNTQSFKPVRIPQAVLEQLALRKA